MALSVSEACIAIDFRKFNSRTVLKMAAYLIEYADLHVTIEITTHLSETKKLKSTDKLIAYLGQDDKKEYCQ